MIGHSAGGCLALWAAHQLAASGVPPLVLAAAPVADLVKAYEMKVSDEGHVAAPACWKMSFLLEAVPEKAEMNEFKLQLLSSCKHSTTL